MNFIFITGVGLGNAKSDLFWISICRAKDK
jgi:hypothetical protein